MPSKPTNPATKPCNIPNIEYDHSFAEKLHTNMPGLAGIFNFPTTQELWDLVQNDPSTKPIFDAWASERKNFPTNLRGITHKKLMDLASNQSFRPILANNKHPAFRGQTFQQNQLPAQGKAEVNAMNLPLLTALWYIIRLIKAKPVLFPGSRVPSVSVPQTAAAEDISLDAYDVFHAWKLLKWIWWVKVPKTKPRVKPAMPPVFHTDIIDGGSDGSSSSPVKVGDAKDKVSDVKSVPAKEDAAMSTDQNAAGQDTSQDVNRQVSVEETSNQVNEDASKDATGQDAAQGEESKDAAIDTPYGTADEDKVENTISNADTKQIKTGEIESTPKRGLSEDENGEAESGVSKKSKTC